MFAASGPLAAAASSPASTFVTNTTMLPMACYMPKARYGSCWSSGGNRWSDAVCRAETAKRISRRIQARNGGCCRGASQAAEQHYDDLGGGDLEEDDDVLFLHLTSTNSAKKRANKGKEKVETKRKLWQKLIRLVIRDPCCYTAVGNKLASSRKTYPVVSDSARRSAIANAAAMMRRGRSRSSPSSSIRMNFPTLPTITEEESLLESGCPVQVANEGSAHSTACNDSILPPASSSSSPVKRSQFSAGPAEKSYSSEVVRREEEAVDVHALRSEGALGLPTSCGRVGMDEMEEKERHQLVMALSF